MNILKYERINICGCDMCINPKEHYILDRIIECNCNMCKKSKELKIYLTCIQLHFLYLLSHDIDIVNNVINIIKKEYKRKKRLLVIYALFIGKILTMYKEIRYRPYRSGYWECYNRFYKKN